MNNIRLVRSVFILCVVLVLSQRVFSNPVKDCFKTSGSRTFDVCIHREEQSSSRDFLYYMHGLFGSAESWDNDGRELIAEWKNRQMKIPTVITVSAGPIWLLCEKNNSSSSGLLEVFLNSVMPEIENRLGGLPANGRRFLLGVSMGGFNAIQMYTKSPEKFYNVALVSPAIPSISPYASAVDIAMFIFRTKANSKDVLFARSIASSHFPDDKAWTDASPLSLAKKVNSNFPPVYLASVEWDTYGFQEGGLFYARDANNHSGKVQLSIYPGFHGQMKAGEVVDFFSK